jgi:hypothetical protein
MKTLNGVKITKLSTYFASIFLTIRSSNCNNFKLSVFMMVAKNRIELKNHNCQKFNNNEINHLKLHDFVHIDDLDL